MGAEEFAEVEMADAGVGGEVAADRIHRDDVFRIVVFDHGEIAKLTVYSLL